VTGPKSKKLVVVAGANVGLGSALAAVFQDDMRVVALGRLPAIAQVAAEVPGVVPIACELTEPSSIDRALTEIERTIAVPDVVIYNAHRIELRSAVDTTAEAFTEAWRVGCLGAFLVAQRVIPRMRERGAGALVFTGATGSVRGGKRSAAFASAKFALRGLAQSLARELGATGIHVAHVVIDGVIWSERSRALRGTPGDRDGPTRDCGHLSPSRRAGPSAWTHELDLRPHHERF
jgi:NAD(P)-dependent dehydrogenase (short-subunit alcohol dehydrogenase family)